MTAPTIKVSRQRYGKPVWIVRCSWCNDGDFFAALANLAWSLSPSWRVALAAAHLHRRLHQEADCRSCARPVAIPRPNPLRPGLVDLDGRLFELRSSTWAEVTTIPKETR